MALLYTQVVFRLQSELTLFKSAATWYISALAVIGKRLQTLEKVKNEQETDLVMQESYEKRLNILIHGLDENPTLAWEKVDETRKLVENFLSDGL